MTDTAQPARTLKDIARLAGVSPGTVSRALAGKSVVNAETRQRIEALAAEHNFQINQMARRLRAQRTGVIGLAIPLGHERRQRLSDPFFMTLLGHLADELAARDHDVMLSRIIPDDDDWLSRIARSGMADGVLLIGQSDQLAVIEAVAQTYLPLVVWGSNLAGQRHCAVGVDNRLGGRLAGEHLIATGRRHIAFMGEIRTLELAQRHAGLCDALAQAGLPPPYQLDVALAPDLMPDQIAANLSRLQREGRGIDGIVAASDMIAVATMSALAASGVSVPGDVAVTGFDDLPLAERAVPRLTTIRQDLEAGAKAMVEALFARLDGQAAPGLEMPPRLIVRDSA
ncbi:LacI family DNA-binding transcriptional regulator [Sphingomonas sanguinis]|jgi:DNA-binding LacI/PurR family transcriptional regulator|uniref:LacI family DNA-binding transcriptional regulator n=1 Tax=Sphingomonas sp. LC-1 TaxID=3110957 RepID=UPI0021BAD9F6|nr:LacI family DNA-binding transcriptional regulator [Sphingomonas sp. LC-1]MCT8000765.1 LacI family DNA-binding transcriptional regulator [Sphingomonas sp. LC-1]